MKYQKFLVILICLTCVSFGCRNEAPSSLTSEPGADLVDQSHPQVADVAEPNVPTPGRQVTTQSLDEDTEFVKRAASLSQQANEAEAQFDFDAAIRHWQSLVELVSNRYGSDSWQVVNARMALETAQQQRQFTPVQRASLQKIASLQQQVSEDLQKHEYAKAYEATLTASQLTQSLFGKRSYLLGRLQAQAGRIAQMNGQQDLARSYFATALDICEAEFGEPHPEVETLVYTIGYSHQADGDHSSAIPYLQRCAEISERLWGGDQAAYASRCHDLGVAYHAVKDFAAAEKAMLISRDIRQTQLGDQHPQLAHSLRNLAVIHQDQGRLKAAATEYQQAIEIFLARFGQENAFTIDSQLKQATVLSLLKRYPEAEAVLQTVASAQRSSLGDTDSSYCVTLFKLGTIMCYQQKFTQAEPLLSHAMKIQQAKLGPQHHDTQRTTEAYAKLLSRTGRQAESDEILGSVRQVGFEQEEPN